MTIETRIFISKLKHDTNLFMLCLGRKLLDAPGHSAVSNPGTRLSHVSHFFVFSFFVLTLFFRKYN